MNSELTKQTDSDLSKQVDSEAVAKSKEDETLEEVNLDLEGKEKIRQENAEKQYASAFKKIDEGDGTYNQEEFDKLPKWIQKGLVDKGMIELDSGLEVDKTLLDDNLVNQLETKLSEKQRFKELMSLVPKKLPAEQKAKLESKFTQLEGKLGQFEALELALAYAGVKIDKDEAFEKGVRLGKAGLPPEGGAPSHSKSKVSDATIASGAKYGLKAEDYELLNKYKGKSIFTNRAK